MIEARAGCVVVEMLGTTSFYNSDQHPEYVLDQLVGKYGLTEKRAAELIAEAELLKDQ